MIPKRAAPDVLRIALVQSRASEDPAVNLETALRGAGEAAARGARVVCLQELFRTPYFCQTADTERFRMAEPIPGPTTEALARAARERGVTVIGSVFERRAEGVYHNTAVVIGPSGALLGKYRKMHIPDDPGFHEKFYFTPGDTGVVTFPVEEARIAPLVCWDQWYPEAARLATLRGAHVIFYPTAIGRLDEEPPEVGRDQREAWETVQRGHAIANGVFVAAVNRVGREGDIHFWGSSFVADPFGRVIARASESDEEILVADCDLGLVEETRRVWPFLRDRRIDAYGGLSSRLLDS